MYRLRVPATGNAGATVSGTRRLRATSDPTAPDPTPTATAYVAADIGACGGSADRTATLVGPEGVAIAAGDLAYPDGAPADFANCYDPHRGQSKGTDLPGARKP